MPRKFKVTGLVAGQSFYWNGRNYRPLDPLTADMDATPPEALRHLLSPDEGGYYDSLVARQVVTETLNPATNPPEEPEPVSQDPD